MLKIQIDELTRGLSQARGQLETRTRELTEALEQKTAMSEILRVISSSPTELQSALDELAASAARFCDADDVTIHRLEGNDLVAVAHCGPISAMLTPAVRETDIGPACWSVGPFTSRISRPRRRRSRRVAPSPEVGPPDDCRRPAATGGCRGRRRRAAAHQSGAVL